MAPCKIPSKWTKFLRPRQHSGEKWSAINKKNGVTRLFELTNWSVQRLYEAERRSSSAAIPPCEPTNSNQLSKSR
jgi:hypothetical protein